MDKGKIKLVENVEIADNTERREMGDVASTKDETNIIKLANEIMQSENPEELFAIFSALLHISARHGQQASEKL